MKILNQRQIQQKIQRLAIEILENNYEEDELILAGINNRGYRFAQLLQTELEQLNKVPIRMTRIRLNPAAPLDEDIQLEMPMSELTGRAIIVIDDVANTGRTIFYACKPILDVLPKKVEVAVLVDRTHKSFPIKVDYVGLSLATTLKDNIDVQIERTGERAVFLD
jgi:pyrimidine operon attenuation protein/uracil phosphoribosyltransferase